MEILTAKEMQELDRYTTEALGVPQIALMENAGKAVADEINKIAGRRQSVLVVAYKGNNGGDGFVAARHLVTLGYFVTVFLLCREEEISGSAKINLNILRKLNVPIKTKMSELNHLLKSAEIIVDAIFGIGFKGRVEGQIAEAIDLINALHKKYNSLVIAVDVPSGVNATTGKKDRHTIEADITVTFANPKTGLLKYPATDNVGKLVVAQIGIIGNSLKGSKTLRGGKHKAPEYYLPKRISLSNKGSYGKVLIIAGSRNMSGAAYLTAQAALRSGAGLVYLAVPQSIQKIVAPKTREVITIGLPETKEGTLSLKSLAEILKIKADVTALGPGLTTNPETVALIKKLITSLRVKVLVIDADGLNAIADDPSILKKAKAKAKEKVIITPHPGEMARLMRLTVKQIQSDREKYAKQFVHKWKVAVVLKGANTIVAMKDKTYINSSGNPGMASAGVGDVLTGMVAAFVGQQLPLEQAVFMHGFAGDLTSKQKGEYAMIASDLIEQIPNALYRYS
ncbi:MAG: NAD(P)H-hydrate dehydratase [Candidatus Margulisiibacteriota bacterium]